MEWLEGLGLAGLFIGCFLAATVLPLSSDALYIAILYATQQPLMCLIIGTLGNWLGSVVTYYTGWLGRWEWIEKYLHVQRSKLERQKAVVDRYGPWLALACWVPFIGDVFAIALGFYRTPQFKTLTLMLVGKFLRFALWTSLIV